MRLDAPVDSTYNADKVTCDEHCYECKVRFRDPKPRDLMMFLHAWKYEVRFFPFPLCFFFCIQITKF